MPTMSSLERSLKSTRSRLSSSPPKTRWRSCLPLPFSVIGLGRTAGSKGRGRGTRLSCHGPDELLMQPARGGEELPVHRLDCVVAEAQTFEGGQPSAGLGQDEVCRGEVPVARVPGNETEIDGAFGHPGKAQGERGDAGDRRYRADGALELVEQGLRPSGACAL